MRVIVITPSLNKSFKFQSDWPYNNSQVYLLSSIVDDLKSDDKMEFKDTKNQYVYTSLVNYPNNKSLVSQNVYISKNGKINKVEVVDKDGNAQIIMNFKKEKFNKKFDKDYFELSSVLKIDENDEKKIENNSSNSSDGQVDNNKKDDSTNDTTNGTNNTTDNTTNDNANTTNNNTTSDNTNSTNNTTSDNTNSTNNSNTTTNDNTNKTNTTNEEEKTKNTASISDIVYPMYLPNNTYLTSQERVNTDNGERLILTFDGDSSFILVEEVSKIEDDSVVIPTNGEFDFLTDVIGIVKEHSLSWNSNGIDYYMASKVIETSELIDIARSISVLPVSK